MKVVLLLVVLVVVAVCLGWFHFSSSHDTGKPNVTFSVDKDKIEADKNKVVDKMQDLGHKPVDRASDSTLWGRAGRAASAGVGGTPDRRQARLQGHAWTLL